MRVKFLPKNQGFSLIYLIIIIFIISSLIGYFYYYYGNTLLKKDSSDLSKTNINQESPKVIQAGILTSPKISIQETKPEVVTNTKPIQVAVTNPPKNIKTNPVPQPVIQNPTPVYPAVPQVPKSTKILNKKIFLVIFNPKIDGMSTIDKFGWNNPDSITGGAISFFKEVTEGRLNYTVAKRQVIESFPVKVDKFTYTSDTYKKCMSSSNKGSDCHNPDTADYLEILKNTGACELLNNGEIDELWIWGGPYFGFWESNVAGPKAFFVNSGPTTGSTCKKMLPIMGYNYERGLNEAVHNFGHRTESVMKEVYGSWDPQSTHGWNKFSLLDKDKKNLAGCGNTHFTSGSTQDYQYNPKGTFKSNCQEFKNFPFIKGEYRDITCSEWGCSELGYDKYWWKNLPQNDGRSTDKFVNKEIYNNWLLYIFDFSWID